jgi:pyridinium-3,5-bisthiocarboxylic acid mononucleotide nickel chelatase
MKTLYFDLIAGASGDMILGALIDAGLPADQLRTALTALKIDDFELAVERVDKNGFSATKVDVLVKDDVPARHLPAIEAIITDSDLPAHIQEKAMALFRRLGGVEAGIHGTSLDEVHLHELGGVDTIVDVVGVLLGLEMLGIERVIVSPIPLGRGFVKGAHGQIPLPAPATIALLKAAPIVGSPIEKETVTPTGAVLLTSLAESFGPIPAMRLEAIGYGAGGRNLPIPNLLRVLIGEQDDPNSATFSTLVLLETNIDDLNPEFYAHVMDQLFAAGALDVFFTPIQMKKNRPATLLQVLAKPGEADKLRAILFRETTTLGVRQKLIERYALDRKFRQVETPFGRVPVKVAKLGDGTLKISPEYENCRQIALEKSIPIQTIYQAAIQAAQTEEPNQGRNLDR